MVMAEGARIFVGGAAAGSALAWMSARMLAALVQGTASWQAVPLLAAGSLLALVVIVATYVPARRATHVDPMISLRAE
jgi:ABC-type antimicrobial peptide transport system permease subunit